MSRVQQLRLRFEQPNNNPPHRAPRRDRILPTLERSILRQSFRTTQASASQPRPQDNTIQISSLSLLSIQNPVPEVIELRLSSHDEQTILHPTPVSPLQSAQPLSPVRGRIANLEGRLQIEHHAQHEQKVQNEKLLGNRLDALQRRQLSFKEKARRELEEAAARRRWCAVCFDEMDMAGMKEAPCGHWYCISCIEEAFTHALTSRTELRCCAVPLPLNLHPRASKRFLSQYADLVLELHTPNPLYCANSRCSAFLPPALVFGPDVAHCVRCYTQTCRHCRDRAHIKTVCARDEGRNAAVRLGEQEGWRMCPRCGNGVERSGGCLHITCRCMTEFCYRCGGLWKDCESSCAEGERAGGEHR